MFDIFNFNKNPFLLPFLCKELTVLHNMRAKLSFALVLISYNKQVINAFLLLTPNSRISLTSRVAHLECIPAAPAQSLQSSYENEHRHEIYEVNENSATRNMDKLEQQAKNEGLAKVQDRGLIDKFNTNQATTERSLREGNEDISQEHARVKSEYKKQSKKNLMRQAFEQELNHVLDVVNAGLESIGFIKEEKQDK